jgi:LPXTG-motif cell wall-anchored protein
MMGRNAPARALALTLVLGAGLVAPVAAEETTTATTPQATTPTTTTTTDQAPPPTTTAEAPPPTATKAAKPPPTPAPRPASSAPNPIAEAAASGGVSIQGFAFHPGSMTVNVGDTVTWTNHDSASHTATANDGSFDTGTLKPGQSGSHTFNRAGTFSYICSIHPNMHGTITVVGSAASGSSSGSGSGNSSSGSSGTSSTASSSSNGSSLPNTGLQIGAVALLGLALLGAGGLLRRVTRPED